MEGRPLGGFDRTVSELKRGADKACRVRSPRFDRTVSELKLVLQQMHLQTS